MISRNNPQTQQPLLHDLGAEASRGVGQITDRDVPGPPIEPINNARSRADVPAKSDQNRDGNKRASDENCDRFTHGKVVLGLRLARMALRITGNRELADAARVLPLIPRRRVSISLEPQNLLGSAPALSANWYLWKTEAELGRHLLE